ncbi:MAG TPA: BON domain-containing protein [Terriglobales bacterium]|nr:BON domain-containing protein [Terriglobales bacterium]
MRSSAAISAIVFLVLGLAFSLGCNNHPATANASNSATTNPANNADVKDVVSKALEQADLKDIHVSDDAEKNVITLTGAVHSQESKDKATQVAKGAAPNRIIANEISVQPVGAESQARNIAGNVDDGIQKNFKAAMIANGLDKQHIRASAKNGVLTLKGTVDTQAERDAAQKVGASVPNVSQVVNELQVKNGRGGQ